MQQLRLLAFDDLLLMRHLLGGMSVTAIAGALGLTQPAVTQRIRKMERAFDCRFFDRVGRRVQLTPEARALCNKAAQAVAILDKEATQAAIAVLNLGTRPEVGRSWVWPALTRLRRQHPDLTVHCVFGSGEEILRRMGVGTLDAVLTSAPHTTRGYAALDLAVERYAFTAAPAIARSVRTTADLAQHVLVEHDRSFPFQRYVDPDSRAAMRFRDVWFTGSTETMAEALVAGFGVGIVPEYMVRRDLAARRLRRILPRVRIAADQFRLIYRLDRDIERPIALLAEALKRFGLRPVDPRPRRE